MTLEDLLRWFSLEHPDIAEDLGLHQVLTNIIRDVKKETLERAAREVELCGGAYRSTRERYKEPDPDDTLCSTEEEIRLAEEMAARIRKLSVE